MKLDLNAELYPIVTPDGIKVDLFIGDNDNPIEMMVPWEKFIEEEISFHCLNTDPNPIPVSKGYDGVSEIIEVIKSLRKVADTLSERLLEKQIFMRDMWLNDNSPEEKNNYLVDFETYLDFINNDQ